MTKNDHKETAKELDNKLPPTIEELEDKVAPASLGIRLNHNETLIRDLDD